MDDAKLRLKPCPMCGGLPLLLVMRQLQDCTIMVECTACGLQSLGIAFAGRVATAEQRKLLPGLRAARRQVMLAWNERVCEDGSHSA